LIVHYAPRDGRERGVVGATSTCPATTTRADDNSSGVAVLLEVARMLQRGAAGGVRADRAGRLHARGAPCFGGPEMGSVQHARRLPEQHGEVRLVMGIEMVGYFDDALFSQVYPMPLFFAF
jgi:Zn-dependent M28 family amino/carboxypeptidase